MTILIAAIPTFEIIEMLNKSVLHVEQSYPNTNLHKGAYLAAQQFVRQLHDLMGTDLGVPVERMGEINMDKSVLRDLDAMLSEEIAKLP